MAWIKVPDDFADSEPYASAGALALVLHFAATAWCNRYLTDGHLPRRMVTRLVDFEDVPADLDAALGHGVSNGVTNGGPNSDVTPPLARFLVERLLKAGLWETTDDGYNLTDYFPLQRSAEQIRGAKDGNAARQKRFRQNQAGPESPAERNGVTNGPVTALKNKNKNKKEQEQNPSSEPGFGPGETRPELAELCNHLADRIEANGSKRPSVTGTWLTACRLLIDADGRTAVQVRAAIDWCQNDDFWRGNIGSMPKLRKQYDQLRLQAMRSTTPNRQSPGDRAMAGLTARREARAARGETPAPRPTVVDLSDPTRFLPASEGIL